MSWQNCKYCEDYEIFSDYPYQIRKKSTKRIIKEHYQQGYIFVHINLINTHKARIIATQFIGEANDNEEVDLILYIPGSKTFNDYLIKPMVTTNLNAIYDDFVPYISDNDTLVEDIVDMKNDVSSLHVSVNNDIAELNSNLDALEYNDVAGGKNICKALDNSVINHLFVIRFLSIS